MSRSISLNFFIRLKSLNRLGDNMLKFCILIIKYYIVYLGLF